MVQSKFLVSHLSPTPSLFLPLKQVSELQRICNCSSSGSSGSYAFSSLSTGSKICSQGIPVPRGRRQWCTHHSTSYSSQLPTCSPTLTVFNPLQRAEICPHPGEMAV